MADRRASERFEVAGSLWGTLEFHEAVVVRNLGEGGLMVEVTPDSSLGSFRAADISLTGSGIDLPAIVRHVSPQSDENAAGRHLVGLEFVNLSRSVRLELDQLIAEWRSPME
jgi:PilZ domain